MEEEDSRRPTPVRMVVDFCLKLNFGNGAFANLGFLPDAAATLPLDRLP
jgi:hypothetical protein